MTYDLLAKNPEDPKELCEISSELKSGLSMILQTEKSRGDDKILATRSSQINPEGMT
jgi:hypothetical protein